MTWGGCRKSKLKKGRLTALVANGQGDIFELNGYVAVGKAGSSLVALRTDQTIPMPHGSE